MIALPPNYLLAIPMGNLEKFFKPPCTLLSIIKSPFRWHFSLTTLLKLVILLCDRSNILSLSVKNGRDSMLSMWHSGRWSSSKFWNLIGDSSCRILLHGNSKRWRYNYQIWSGRPQHCKSGWGKAASRQSIICLIRRLSNYGRWGAFGVFRFWLVLILWWDDPRSFASSAWILTWIFPGKGSETLRQ